MKKSIFARFFLLAWIILWILAFMFIPSRVDFIHGGRLGDFNDFPQKLALFKPAAAITDVIRSFGAASLLTYAYTVLGSFVFSLSSREYYSDKKPSYSEWIAIVSTSFILGHAIFSFIFLLLGVNHLFDAKYLWMVLITGTVIGARSLNSLYGKLPPITNARISDWWNQVRYKGIFILTISILLAGLFYTNTRLSYDAAAFYFSDEKLTSLGGGINFFQNDSFIASSFQTGITYAALITLAGDQAARMYSWVNGLIIIFFSFTIAKKLGLSLQASLISGALLLTSTAFVDLTGDGKIDLISTVPAMAAVYWTIVNIKGQYKSVAFLTGVMTGIAIVSRPFNAFLVCLFIGTHYILSFLSTKDKPEQLAIIKVIPLLGIGIILPAISHIIVNQFILGDPLSFLRNLQVANSSNWQWTFDKDNLWTIRLLYPFALTIINIPQSNGNISPLFVAFLPVLFNRAVINVFKELPILLRTVTAAIITLVIWNIVLFTVFEIRYVLFLWAIIYIAFAVAIEETLSASDRFLGKFFELTIIVVLLFATARMAYIVVDTYSPVDKTNTPHCTDHDLCAILDPINQNALLGERVFTLSAFRYYLRPDLLACSSRHDEYRSLQVLANNDIENFWVELYKYGFKYITFESRYSKIHMGFNFFPENDSVPDWMHLELLSIYPSNSASYEIIVNKPPIFMQKQCTQTSSGIWLLSDIK